MIATTGLLKEQQFLYYIELYEEDSWHCFVPLIQGNGTNNELTIFDVLHFNSDIPTTPAYRVCISHLIHYSRVCPHYIMIFLLKVKSYFKYIVVIIMILLTATSHMCYLACIFHSFPSKTM